MAHTMFDHVEGSDDIARSKLKHTMTISNSEEINKKKHKTKMKRKEKRTRIRFPPCFFLSLSLAT